MSIVLNLEQRDLILTFHRYMNRRELSLGVYEKHIIGDMADKISKGAPVGVDDNHIVKLNRIRRMYIDKILNK